MKTLIIFDSFKSSSSSEELNSVVEKELSKTIDKGKLLSIPYSDGGEGFLNTIKYIHEDAIEKEESTFDQMHRTKVVPYLELKDKTIVIETAKIVGYQDNSNPAILTTFGVGALIKKLAKKGYSKFMLGIGGSSTNDMGLGFLHALDYKFYSRYNDPIFPMPANFGLVSKIIPSDKYSNLSFDVYCDVNCPLLGKNGATYSFGLQKGIKEIDLPYYESSFYILSKMLNKNNAFVLGTGAGGGLAYALSLFNSQFHFSNDVLSLLNLDNVLENVSSVITGEGCLDDSTFDGKAIYSIAKKCKEKNIPVYLIVGTDNSSNTLKKDLFTKVVSLHSSFDESYLSSTNEDVRKALASLLPYLK